MNNPMILISAMVAYLCVVQAVMQCGNLCIPYKQCPHLNALMHSRQRTHQQTDLLIESVCGFDYDTVKLCCTNPPTPPPPPPPVNLKCFSPNGRPGQCVKVFSCASIMSILQNKTRSKESHQFAVNSLCDGPYPYSVCCELPPTGEEDPRHCRPSAMLPDRKSGCCGISSIYEDRIMGGESASIAEYPWVVLIESQNKQKIKGVHCGGSLISSRYVLTAGHCVVPEMLKEWEPVNIRLGEYNTSESGADCETVDGGGSLCTEGTTTIPIERIIVHPQYKPRSRMRRHDIALIRMKWLAPYTDFIRPICLPTIDITSIEVAEVEFWVAGWGLIDNQNHYSDVMLHVNLNYQTFEQCQPAYTTVPLMKGHLCAGGQKGKDTCKGDSGGPLMYKHNRVFEVTGIVSFGLTPCGIENAPGVYTEVHEYNGWIQSILK